MSRAYSDIAFTPTVRQMQTRMGSRDNYAPLDDTPDRRDRLGGSEAAFIEARDGFYQATVGETGWPYVQFRGGPAGFLKVLDDGKTIGYADFRGNVQYISVGNLQGDDRVSIIFMDYARQRRLKVLGRARLVDIRDDPALIEQLRSTNYRAQVERAVLITVEGFDWNCPQHITPRFTEQEIALATAPLRQQLEAAQRALQASALQASPTPPPSLGHGPLALAITGIQQLTPRIRAYTLQRDDGQPLPPVSAGAHMQVPVRLANGTESTRSYSISAHSPDRNAWEIAVLRDDAGRGGSNAVHDDYHLGMVLKCAMPSNAFALDAAAGPVILIAGGVGITPIRAMVNALSNDEAQAKRPFVLHYAARSRAEAAYFDSLAYLLRDQLYFYDQSQGHTLDASSLVANAPPDTTIYVCGPSGLIDAVRNAAQAHGWPDHRVRFERFAADAAISTVNKAVKVTLRRSGKVIEVAPQQTILEAVEASGIFPPASCRTGTCGTCAVKVLAGKPDHRDSVLGDAERQQAALMCICVSRASTSDLELDV
jgi:ferredoxin-NADP reductase/predicted pyridoxine 5'-phosphate oxidase superfamily flavin-nucleotide-binding protein